MIWSMNSHLKIVTTWFFSPRGIFKVLFKTKGKKSLIINLSGNYIERQFSAILNFCLLCLSIISIYFPIVYSYMVLHLPVDSTKDNIIYFVLFICYLIYVKIILRSIFPLMIISWEQLCQIVDKNVTIHFSLIRLHLFFFF